MTCALSRLAVHNTRLFLVTVYGLRFTAFMATKKSTTKKATTKTTSRAKKAAGASKAGALARRPGVTLVTGGTGFLGSHLVRLLVDEGVKPLRVLSTSAPAWLEELGVESVEGSITSPEDVLRAVEGVAEIYHLAGRV